MEISKIELNNQEYNKLLKILKKYMNIFKTLYLLDPSIANDFRKKQEYYHKLSHPDGKENSHSCCANKLDRKSIM